MSEERRSVHIYRRVLGMMGWTVECNLPTESKYVIIGAPHTSNWDFVFMLLTRGALGIRPRWLGKHTLFRSILGPVMKWLGGIPVDRSAPHDLVAAVARIIESHDAICLIITPEGTRSNAPRWKTGFYHIAQAAKVPIAFGYIDFERRSCGIGRSLMPTGDIESDFAVIKRFYSRIVGRRPDKQGPIVLQSGSERNS
ncbi:MAG: lysophospholipid acyltransferase family protein [Gemmatimonadales bacterium]